MESIQTYRNFGDFMTDTIEKQKREIEEHKQKILLKEKILKAKEDKRRAKKFEEIGRISFKANIDYLEKEILLGAFLEIYNKAKSEENIDQWKRSGKEFLSGSKKENHKALAVSFDEEPSKEAKRKLKDLKFQYNKFRKEFYGYGDDEELRNILVGTNAKIEVIS